VDRRSIAVSLCYWLYKAFYYLILYSALILVNIKTLKIFYIKALKVY